MNLIHKIMECLAKSGKHESHIYYDLLTKYNLPSNYLSLAKAELDYLVKNRIVVKYNVNGYSEDFFRLVF